MLIHIPRTFITTQVAQALEEDIGDGDITAMLIPDEKIISAKVVCRDNGVLCGKDWFNEVFKQLQPSIEINWYKSDGEELHANDVICDLSGPAYSILSGERTALNFLQTLSGTASMTNKYVKAILGTDCRVLDTRKTIPGYRLPQKYAVHCGGGSNHRLGLYDMVLIKENHIVACGSIKAAVEKAKSFAVGFDIEVEVETIGELKQALVSGVDRVLLDNMDVETLKKAVEINQGRAELEASGNITLNNVRSYAETGVNYVSIGGITKNLDSIDFSMRFDDL